MADETQTDTAATTTATTDADLAASKDGGDATVADTGTAAGADGADADTSTVLGTAATDEGTGDEGGDTKEGDKGDPETIVPEAYDLKLTIKTDDGKDEEITIDPVLLDEATPVLKDLGLTNDQANKVAALVPKVQERLIQQQNDAFAETRAQWAKDAQADAEIGGKNWKESKSLAAKALDHFVGPAVVKDAKGNETKNAFRQLLDDTGLGNHPEMIRTFRKIGAGLAEDGTLARGAATAKEKPDRLTRLYPEDVPKK
jgi:hypothetical protein